MPASSRSRIPAARACIGRSPEAFAVGLTRIPMHPDEHDSYFAAGQPHLVTASVIVMAIVFFLLGSCAIALNQTFFSDTTGSDAPTGAGASRGGRVGAYESRSHRPVVPAETSGSCPVLCRYPRGDASRRLLNSCPSKIRAYGTQAVRGDAPRAAGSFPFTSAGGQDRTRTFWGARARGCDAGRVDIRPQVQVGVSTTAKGASLPAGGFSFPRPPTHTGNCTPC